MGKSFEELCSMGAEEAMDMLVDGIKDEGRFEFCRWEDARYLLALEKHYLATKKPEVIPEAISVCALNDFPMPKWCAMAYLAAFRKVKQYRVGNSWDDVFGKPHPKNTKIEAKRDEREKALGVHLRVKEIKKRDPSVPIDRELFGRVGSEFCIGDSLAEKYYYKWENKLKLYK